MYRVIFKYGDTEVESIRDFLTLAEAQAEASAGIENGADDAWPEEITRSE